MDRVRRKNEERTNGGKVEEEVQVKRNGNPKNEGRVHHTLHEV